MAKRKLQVFYHQLGPVYVVESHVKQIMRMATDGEFTRLDTKVSFVGTTKGQVIFTYETEYGKGKVILEGQKHETN